MVTAAGPASVELVAQLIQTIGGQPGRRLPIIDGLAATLPNASLTVLAATPLVKHVALDRVILGAMERTGATVGAPAVRDELGVDGSGVVVAVVDSGIAAAADDLSDTASGSLRIDRFVDFVNGREAPYDDYGHGTHVAGIIAGNGFDSSGARSGIAPRARLVSLKALDGSGQGRISNVIAAIDYAVRHRIELKIRVINLSIGAGVYESYYLDPLTLAARQAVAAGIVVVASAGNLGRDAQGRTLYGGITAPGNAPCVVTVGASSHMGTVDRADDTIAAFSSRGPTAIDRAAKPDLVAPGVGIESVSAPDSLLYRSMSAYLLSGTVSTPYLPYLSLSGTSMAAPVVAGTAALMLQANPTLTPNAIKAILEYTAQMYPAYDVLTEGAGFLNARGAVELARFLAVPSTGYPSSKGWSRRILWGNYVVRGAFIPGATAWSSSVGWGETTSAHGTSLGQGAICVTDCDSAPPGPSDPFLTAPEGRSNVVWGLMCGGADCPGGTPWTSPSGTTVVWGSTGGDTVVWGSTGGDTVVWGSGCTDQSCDVRWP